MPAEEVGAVGQVGRVTIFLFFSRLTGIDKEDIMIEPTSKHVCPYCGASLREYSTPYFDDETGQMTQDWECSKCEYSESEELNSF